MKNKLTIILLILAVTFSFAACSNQTEALQNSTNFEKYKNFYSTAVQYSGENESAEKYLEIAEKSAQLFPVLEEKADAFVAEAYNYQSIDEEGTPLYEQNTLKYPVEISPNGQSMRVSKNYFKYNPIDTADGSDLVEQFIYDDLTLNILVPEKYKDMKEQIIEAYLENFYFEKVIATNDYNEMAGIDATLDISKDDLKINIIYVKDNQEYFTFRSDCAVLTDNVITDPIVQIYTSNIHCNYAHSILTQWCFFYSEKENSDEAYNDILPILKQCKADNIQKVGCVYDENMQ